MTQLSPHAVETGSDGEVLPAGLEPAANAERLWPHVASRGWRHALLRRMLALADVAAAIAVSVSLLLVSDGSASRFVWSLALVPAWIVVAKLLGLYDRDQAALRHLTIDEVPQLVLLAILGTVGTVLVAELASASRPDAEAALVACVVAAISLFVLRGTARLLWRAVTPPERVAILGTPPTAATVRRKLSLAPGSHVRVVHERERLDADAVRDAAWLEAVDRVVYAPPSLAENQASALLDLARATGVGVSIIPPARDLFGAGVHLNRLAELPLLEYRTRDLSRSTLFLKRALDIVVSAVALVVLLPFFVLIALAIKLDTRGPAIFSQLRGGVRGKPFRLYKFRSMCRDAEEQLSRLIDFDDLVELRLKVPDDPRVTRVGRFLRRWSLDELPQLFNVLRGDMSLVGPRPEQLPVIERYAPEHRIRLAVKPGITGPMQVSGRAETSWEERLALECDYVENLSIGEDVRIMAMTLGVVLGRRGAY